MITSNCGVAKEVKHGTIINYVGIKWKKGYDQKEEEYFSYKLMTGSVTEVDALVVRTSHENTFEIKPYTFSVIVNFPYSEEEIRGSMLQQFGVILVVAASVGMLQGSTKDTKETKIFFGCMLCYLELLH